MMAEARALIMFLRFTHYAFTVALISIYGVVVYFLW